MIGVADAAREVARHTADGWIDDELRPDKQLPLSDDELAELVSLTSRLTPDERRAYGPPLCQIDQLYETPTLTSVWSRLEVAATTSQAVAAEVNLTATAATGRESLQAVVSGLREHRALVHWAMETAWAVVHRAVVNSEAQRERWRQIVGQMVTEATAATRLGVPLAAHNIEVPPDVDGRDIGPILAELGERFAAGKGLPKFGGGDLKQLVERSTIDGRRPASPQDLELIDGHRQLTEHRRRLTTLWANELVPLGMPGLDGPRPEEQFQSIYQQSLETLLSVSDKASELERQLRPLVYRHPDLATIPGVDAVLQLFEAASALFDGDDAQVWLDGFGKYLQQVAQQGHPTSLALHQAFVARDPAAWQLSIDAVRRLHVLEPQLARHAQLVARLADVVPRLADAYRSGTLSYEPRQVRAAWRHRQLKLWVDGIVGLGDQATLSSRIAALEQEELRLVTRVVAAKAWLQMAKRTTGAQRSALETWAQAMARIGKGTGKHAPRHRQTAQRAMRSAQNAVPVWIMSIAQAIASFRPGDDTAFDVVIVDEASQAPFDTLAVLGLGQRVLVVGDDKQISPTIFYDETEADQLRRQHLADVPDADGYDIRTSLYDTASRRFPGVIQLQEHFRCLPEIIAFSNDLSYEGRIDPLREHHPDPAWLPVRAERVPDGYRDGQVNRPEADKVVELVQGLIADPALAPGSRYEHGASIGIVSMLGSDQAKLIQSQLIEQIPVDELETRQIRIGSPYEFQGDERDVIIVSMVDAINRERRVTGRAATGRQEQQRYNVAASRARDQLIVIHSFDPGQLGEGDFRRRFVSFAQSPRRAMQAVGDLREQCESQFERDVLERLLTLDLRVVGQYPVAGYRIDFTVTDVHGRRAAIECDGDSFHGIDQLRADSDRQRILERLGWRFVRVRASEYYLDPERSFALLVDRIHNHGLQAISRT